LAPLQFSKNQLPLHNSTKSCQGSSLPAEAAPCRTTLLSPSFTSSTCGPSISNTLLPPVARPRQHHETFRSGAGLPDSGIVGRLSAARIEEQDRSSSAHFAVSSTILSVALRWVKRPWLGAPRSPVRPSAAPSGGGSGAGPGGPRDLPPFPRPGDVDRVFEGLLGLKPQEHRDLQAQGRGALKGLSYCLLGPVSSGIMDL
jgi:hypothetical protein